MLKDGYEVAHTQHEIASAKPIKTNFTGAKIESKDEYAIIKGDDFIYKFNTHYGYIEDLDGYLNSPMKLSVWRAPTDNDKHIRLKWQDNNYNKVHNKVYDIKIKDNTIIVHAGLASLSRMNFINYTLTYR